MKNFLLLILAVSSLASCSSLQKFIQPRLPALADTALKVAVHYKKITSAQADFVRDHGQLILDAAASNRTETKVLAISTVAVDYAESIGKLSPENATILREAGAVALSPQAPIPPPAVLFGPLSDNPLLTALNPAK